MKSKRLWSCLLVLAVMITVFGFSAYVHEVSAAAGDEGYTIDRPYEYPIKPGTDEWFSIVCHADKVEMLQIPQEILENMTTDALVESVGNYPYFPDMDAFSTQELGYKAVRDGFNGLRELESRPDGMSCLSAYFENQKTTHPGDMRYVVRRAIEITLAETGNE